MSASNDEITFSGEPLDRSPWAAAPIPPGPPQMPVPGGYPSHMPVPDGYPSHMPVPQNLPPTAVSDGSLQAHDAGSLDWLTKLRAQIFLAHRAALLAQHALLEAATGPGVGAGVTGPAAAGAHLPAAARARPLDDPRRSADGGGTPAGLALDEQVPIAALLDGLLQDEIIAGRPARRLLEATLIFRGELPLEGETVRWEAGVDQVVGVVATFHATCHAGGQPVIELTGGQAGPAEAAGEPAGPPHSRAYEAASFRPLARTDKRSLDAEDIALLAAGRIADVFGAGYRQEGCNPSLRLPGGRQRTIDRIDDIDARGGRRGLGTLSAAGHVEAPATAPESLIIDGAAQLLQAYLLYLGAHLVLPDARFQPVTGLASQITVTGPIPAEIAALRYEAEVVELGLLDRPHAVADVTVYDDARKIMMIHDIGVQIREKPGTPYGPGPGGRVEAFLGRTNQQGERALLNELHMAHAAQGDLAVAMGPEFGIYRTSRAPYIPNGDFLFVDRMMDWRGDRGRLVPGATMVTEYDSPTDSWYYQDNGHPFLPHCVLMETSLQSAVLLGYYLGATLPYPDQQFSIRNLDGHAVVVKDVDLRGKTVRQHSTLLSNDAMTGAVLQRFRYELSADGERFYTGESLFGYFSDQALASQVGLDAGRFVGRWRGGRGGDGAGSVRRIDLRDNAQRERLTAGGGLRLGSGRLQLIDWVDLIPEGGEHGAGYLRGYRRITPDEWYFSCHFHQDPVMPGSLGVEAILQAMQLYAIETGLAAGLDRPQFALAAGIELGWRYRGQILRTDADMDFEVHIKEVRREPGRVLLIGDANLWKPGLRIYELKNIAIAVVSGGRLTPP